MGKLSLNDLWYRYLISTLPANVVDGSAEPTPGIKNGSSSFIIHWNNTAPTAGTVVASRGASVEGLYRIDIITYLSGSGTPAGIDADNLKLYYGGPEQSIIVIPQKNTPSPLQTVYTYLTESAFVDLTVLENGTANVEYRGTFTFTRVGD